MTGSTMVRGAQHCDQFLVSGVGEDVGRVRRTPTSASSSTSSFGANCPDSAAMTQ